MDGREYSKAVTKEALKWLISEPKPILSPTLAHARLGLVGHMAPGADSSANAAPAFGNGNTAGSIFDDAKPTGSIFGHSTSIFADGTARGGVLPLASGSAGELVKQEPAEQAARKANPWRPRLKQMNAWKKVRALPELSDHEVSDMA